MEQRKRIAIVFQGVRCDSMTVGENVGYRLFEAGQLSEAEIERIVLEKLSFVGVEEAVNLYPSELSGGMKSGLPLPAPWRPIRTTSSLTSPTTGLGSDRGLQHL